MREQKANTVILQVTLLQGTQVHIYPLVMGRGIPLKYLQIPIICRTVSKNDSNSDSEAKPLVSGSKPPSDWDEDLIDLTQTENASNKNNPLPSDWSDEENLCCKAKAQLQVTPRQPPPGWASWRRKGSLPVISKNKSIPLENKVSSKTDPEIEVYYETPEDIPNDIDKGNPKLISPEEFDTM